MVLQMAKWKYYIRLLIWTWPCADIPISLPICSTPLPLQYICYIPTGTVTDGEFSSLRTQGETRPIHLWQLIHDAKQTVRKMSKQKLESLLQCIPDTVTMHKILFWSTYVNTCPEVCPLKTPPHPPPQSTPCQVEECCCAGLHVNTCSCARRQQTVRVAVVPCRTCSWSLH